MPDLKFRDKKTGAVITIPWDGPGMPSEGEIEAIRNRPSARPNPGMKRTPQATLTADALALAQKAGGDQKPLSKNQLDAGERPSIGGWQTAKATMQSEIPVVGDELRAAKEGLGRRIEQGVDKGYTPDLPIMGNPGLGFARLMAGSIPTTMLDAALTAGPALLGKGWSMAKGLLGGMSKTEPMIAEQIARSVKGVPERPLSPGSLKMTPGTPPSGAVNPAATSTVRIPQVGGPGGGGASVALEDPLDTVARKMAAEGPLPTPKDAHPKVPLTGTPSASAAAKGAKESAQVAKQQAIDDKNLTDVEKWLSARRAKAAAEAQAKEAAITKMGDEATKAAVKETTGFTDTLEKSLTKALGEVAGKNAPANKGLASLDEAIAAEKAAVAKRVASIKKNKPNLEKAVEAREPYVDNLESNRASYEAARLKREAAQAAKVASVAKPMAVAPPAAKVAPVKVVAKAAGKSAKVAESQAGADELGKIWEAKGVPADAPAPKVEGVKGQRAVDPQTQVDDLVKAGVPEKTAWRYVANQAAEEAVPAVEAAIDPRQKAAQDLADAIFKRQAESTGASADTILKQGGVYTGEENLANAKDIARNSFAKRTGNLGDAPAAKAARGKFAKDLGGLDKAGQGVQAGTIDPSTLHSGIDPQQLFRLLKSPLGRGVAGATIGGNVDDESPLRGAVIGGMLGAGLGPDSQGAWKLFDKARYEALLSGLPQATNIAGNIGSLWTAPIMRGLQGYPEEALSLMKSYTKPGEVARTAVDGWKRGWARAAEGAPMKFGPSEGAQQVRAFGPFSKNLHAVDEATNSILQQGGIPAEVGDVYTYRGNPQTNWGAGTGMLQSSLPGRLIAPFARTGLNLAELGSSMSPLRWLPKDALGVRKILPVNPSLTGFTKGVHEAGLGLMGAAVEEAGRHNIGPHSALGTAALGPFAFPYAIGHGIYDYNQYNKDDNSIVAAAKATTENIPLLGDIPQALQDPGKFVRSLIASPVPSMFKMPLLGTDPTVRDPKTISGAIQEKIPGRLGGIDMPWKGKFGSETLEPKLTMWGDEMKRGATGGVGGWLSGMLGQYPLAQYETDPVAAKAGELGLLRRHAPTGWGGGASPLQRIQALGLQQTLGANPAMAEMFAGLPTGVRDAITPGREAATQTEQTAGGKIVGPAIHHALTALFASPQFQQLDPEMQAAVAAWVKDQAQGQAGKIVNQQMLTRP